MTLWNKTYWFNDAVTQVSCKKEKFFRVFTHKIQNSKKSTLLFLHSLSKVNIIFETAANKAFSCCNANHSKYILHFNDISFNALLDGERLEKSFCLAWCKKILHTTKPRRAWNALWIWYVSKNSIPTKSWFLYFTCTYVKFAFVLNSNNTKLYFTQRWNRTSLPVVSYYAICILYFNRLYYCWKCTLWLSWMNHSIFSGQGFWRLVWDYIQCLQCSVFHFKNTWISRIFVKLLFNMAFIDWTHVCPMYLLLSLVKWKDFDFSRYANTFEISPLH